ncbi:hypothetical protein G6F59_017950 [Rhizopus arrhizus]|nr:hypothetical protein G6F59_017950 [Rhizopus arrhizus]
MAPEPPSRSRTSASSAALRARRPSLVSRCSATWRCRSQTLNQPPLPSHSGYWIKPTSTNSTRNNRRIRENPQSSRGADAAAAPGAAAALPINAGCRKLPGQDTTPLQPALPRYAGAGCTWPCDPNGTANPS